MFLIHAEVRADVEGVQREEMRCSTWNLGVEAIYALFATGYFAGTEGINNFSFLFVKSVITEIIYHEVPDKTLKQSFTR